MLNADERKEYKSLERELKISGFYCEGMEKCRLVEAADYIQQHGAFHLFDRLIRTTKLNHFRLLKAVLILFSTVQVDSTIKGSGKLDTLIQFLTESAAILAKKPLKIEKRNNEDSIMKRVGSILKRQKKTDKSLIQINLGEYLMKQLVEPLLAILSRIQCVYHQVYRPTQEEMSDELCWATLNLINKFGELNRVYESMGRYYESEFSGAALQTLNIIDYDIKILYSRVGMHLKKRMECLQKNIIEEKQKSLSEEQEVDLKQILMFVGELDQLNDNLRVLYLGKYFAQMFYFSHIRMPILFRGTYTLDNLDKMVRQNVHNRTSLDLREEEMTIRETSRNFHLKFVCNHEQQDRDKEQNGLSTQEEGINSNSIRKRGLEEELAQ